MNSLITAGGIVAANTFCERLYLPGLAAVWLLAIQPLHAPGAEPQPASPKNSTDLKEEELGPDSQRQEGVPKGEIKTLNPIHSYKESKMYSIIQKHIDESKQQSDTQKSMLNTEYTYTRACWYSKSPHEVAAESL